jgi:hypothetical protein
VTISDLEAMYLDAAKAELDARDRLIQEALEKSGQSAERPIEKSEDTAMAQQKVDETLRHMRALKREEFLNRVPWCGGRADNPGAHAPFEPKTKRDWMLS